VGTPRISILDMSKGTPLRNIRIDDDLWDRIGNVALARGTDRSEVVRAAVEHALARLKDFKPVPYVIQEDSLFDS